MWCFQLFNILVWVHNGLVAAIQSTKRGYVVASWGPDQLLEQIDKKEYQFQINIL
jgi:hypothetical protein